VTARRKLDSAAVEDYCGAKPSSKRTKPFGPEPIVFKIRGKMFALLGEHAGHESVSLKCDPERSTTLRESFAAIVPGWHLNKEHWNTLHLDGSLATSLVHELIDHSYELVAAKATSRRSPSRPRRASAARTRGRGRRRAAAS
jgi:predicted DNA-binding protein (MmcQ/YjbR family)